MNQSKTAAAFRTTVPPASMRLHVPVAALSLVVAFTPGAAGDQTRQFRAAVDLVRIDVSVLDRDRRPITGLTAADFTVLEDGRPQPIAAFSEIVVPGALEPPNSWLRLAPFDVRRNDDGASRRIVVIVMDDMTLPPDPRMIANARAIGLGVVGRLGGSDLGAVVFTRDTMAGQDFTPDRAQLAAAVERVTGGTRDLAPSEEEHQEHLFIAALDTLGRAAAHLAAIPERRKTLVYVSVGMPFDASTAAGAAVGGPGGLSRPAVRQTELHARLRDRLATVLGQAQRANVAIYSVDPSGVGGLESAILRAEMRQIGPVPRAPLTSATIDIAASRQAALYATFLHAVAESTGGRAVVHTSDFDAGLDQIFRESGSYYLLGIEPRDRPSAGAHRRLEVRVTRAGVEVRARSAYYGVDERTEPGASRPLLTTALAGALPRGDLPLQATAAPFAVPGRREAAVAVVIGVEQPVPDGAEPLREAVQIIVTAFDSRGEPRGSTPTLARLALRPGAAVQYELLSRIDLDPGRYQLRIAAESTLLGRAGSVYYDVDVPDFGREPLSVSGTVLSVDPPLGSAPRERLASLLPLVPTTQRAFWRTDRVTAFLRVYQGGPAPTVPAAIRAVILDAGGHPVFDMTEPVPASRFGPERAAEFSLELPTGGFAPGPYLLIVEASAGGRSQVREVRFAVH